MFIAVLFMIAKIWKQPKCLLNRWMDKEDEVYTHNGILLSHKKEWNFAICSDDMGDFVGVMLSERSQTEK